MVTERSAIRILAMILIGGSFAAPALGRSLHRHTSFHFHHGLQPHETASPSASTNRPNEIHAIDGHEVDDRHEAKTPDTRQGTDDNAASGKEVVTPGRGPKQDTVRGERQGGKGKEDISGTRQGQVPLGGLPSYKPGPLDTSITVMGRGIADERQPHPGSKSKFRLIIPGTTRAFYSRIPRAEHHSARNAIGARIEASSGGRPRGGPADLRSVATPTVGAPATRMTGLSTKPSAHDDRPQLVRPGTGPTTPIVGHAAAINGTGMARRGNNPFVGGPPRVIAGISGSMFRPRH